MKSVNAHRPTKVVDLVLGDNTKDTSPEEVTVYSFDDHKVIINKIDDKDSDVSDFNFSDIYEDETDISEILENFTQMQPLSISDQELLEIFMDCYQNTLERYRPFLSRFSECKDVAKVLDLRSLVERLTVIIQNASFEFLKKKQLRSCIECELKTLTDLVNKYRSYSKSSFTNSERRVEAHLFPVFIGDQLYGYELVTKTTEGSLNKSEENFDYV